MSQYRKNFLPAAADATLVGAGPYVRVKITGAKLSNGLYPVGLAGAGEMSIGNLDGTRANKLNDPVNVILRNADQTKIMVAAAALAVGATVFAAASGKVSGVGSVEEGIAIEAATNAGDYVEVIPTPRSRVNMPLQAIAASGAVDPHTTANYVITDAGVAALTLAAPTAGTDDGVELLLTSNTAQAHTLTTVGLLQTGAATVNVATFAAHPGASLRLVAYQGKWNVLSANAVTFT